MRISLKVPKWVQNVCWVKEWVFSNASLDNLLIRSYIVQDSPVLSAWCVLGLTLVSFWLVESSMIRPPYAPDLNRLTYNRHPGLAFWPIMEDLPGRVCGKRAESTDSSLCTYRATASVHKNRLVLEYALNPLSHLLKRKKVYWRAINKTNHGL